MVLQQRQIRLAPEVNESFFSQPGETKAPVFPL
jgi:hypothetical protein